jgi:hypothetical protein
MIAEFYVSFIIAIHNNYAIHNIVFDGEGKEFQFYTFTFG